MSAIFSTFYPFNSTVLVVLLHFHTVLCRIRHSSHRIISNLQQIFVDVRRFSLTFVLLCVHTYQILLDLGWFLQSSHPFGNRSVLLRSILSLKLRLFPLNFVKYEIYDLFDQFRYPLVSNLRASCVIQLTISTKIASRVRDFTLGAFLVLGRLTIIYRILLLHVFILQTQPSSKCRVLFRVFQNLNSLRPHLSLSSFQDWV